MDANILSPNAMLVQGCTMSDFERIISRLLDEKLSKINVYPNNIKEIPKTDLLKRKEAADLLGISLVSLNTWTKAGLIKAYKISTRVYYNRSDIDEALKRMNS
jgi:excisionase family DNA binding protein